MPIRIPDTLPATGILESENIFVMTEYRAIHQDIRPLRVLILNLMPSKIETETMILRKLSNSPLQVNIELLRTESNASGKQMEHMRDFYVTLDEIRSKHYDGMIITGSPVDAQNFEDVGFWPELCEIFEWAKTHVFSTFYISWSAQAGIYYHFGVKNRPLDTPLLGVFPHKVVKASSPLVRGVNDLVWVPRAQDFIVDAADITANRELELVIAGDDAGVYVAKSTDSRHFFVFGHPEYEGDTFALQYRREIEAGGAPKMPQNYFPDDDPTAKPLAYWRSDGQLIYTNWLNYYVYQATPYDIDSLSMGFPNAGSGRFLF